MKAGRGSKSRIINIKSVRDQIARDLLPGTSLQDFLKSLKGLYALTGCDTVSAFAGKGKSKAFKMLMKNGKYVRAFMTIGILMECLQLIVQSDRRICLRIITGRKSRM